MTPALSRSAPTQTLWPAPPLSARAGHHPHPARRTRSREVEEYYATNTEPFVWLIDMGMTKIITSVERRVVANHREREHEHLRKYCKGVAFVVANPLIRGALAAMSWLRRPPYESATFADAAAARKWLSERPL